MVTRRDLLAQLALGLGVAACGRSYAQPAEAAAFVSIETSAQSGLSQARFLSNTGATTGVAPLDFRAHGMTQSGDTLVVFPRRPGDRFAVMSATTLEIRQVITAPMDRHFYGHGSFTLDGRYLIVPENNLETLGGSIGIYEVATFSRVGSVTLPAAGPHEIVRAPLQDKFFIALGGLETHPEYGRTPLNLSTFGSRLVSYDFETGDIDDYGLWAGTEGISLRHLTADRNGTIIIGGQVADTSRANERGTVLWQIKNGNLTPLSDDGALAGYVSSVATDGREVIATSKKGHVALTYIDGELTERVSVDGASSVAMGAKQKLIAGFTDLSLDNHELKATAGYEFDNHGYALIEL